MYENLELEFHFDLKFLFVATRAYCENGLWCTKLTN